MPIEEPKFQVVEEFSGIEIRRMSAYWTVEIELAGEPLWSRYDPPFMPWFLRRNEVQVEVKAKR